ncbi:MAG: HU family DNA-binding protein [bacterium]
MNKAGLVEYVAKQTKMSKKQAEASVNATLDGIKKNLRKDGIVQLVGFGSFTITQSKPRMGRNPQTGAPIKIKATKRVRFRAGKEFKKLL